MLLNDTAQCPQCQHVLDAARVADVEKPAAKAAAKPAVNEEQCPNCGEMVRQGLVRCWNCSAFMRKDIAQAFRKMNDGPRPVIYSESEKRAQQAAADAAAGIEHAVEDDDDFELSPETAAAVNQVTEQLSSSAPSIPAAPAGETKSSQPAESSTLEGVEQPPTGDTEQSAETAASESAEGEADAAGNGATVKDRTTVETEDVTAHSEATGGDVLLQTALDEQAEGEKRRAGRPAGSSGARGDGKAGIVMLCPCDQAARIRVQDRHRGKPLRCPRCAELLLVPDNFRLLVAPKELRNKFQQVEVDLAAKRQKEAEAAKKADEFGRWLHDVHIHSFQPEKLKLKAGSLEKTFEPYDFGFLKEGLLAVKLLKRPVVGRGADKKHGPVREALLEHLKEGKSRDELPVFSKAMFTVDQVKEIRIAQPVRHAHESMFAGVDVFGTGRIAIRFPDTEDQDAPKFASFVLSEFREFSRHLTERYGIENFGADTDIPLEDEFQDAKCHYTDQPLRILQHVEFYEHDPAFELKTVGYKCQSCNLTISEDGRKKEKLGGKTPKGLTKAQCPKCTAKFGYVPLMSIEVSEAETADDDEAPADETAASPAGSESAATAAAEQKS